MTAKSKLEERFMAQLVAAGLDAGVEREVRFCPPRMFRWDFAWPARAVAIEIHGATWAPKGRHTSGAGVEQDAEKLAHAALLGWRCLIVPEKWLRVPAGQEESEAIAWTRALLGRTSP